MVHTKHVATGLTTEVVGHGVADHLACGRTGSTPRRTAEQTAHDELRQNTEPTLAGRAVALDITQANGALRMKPATLPTAAPAF